MYSKQFSSIEQALRFATDATLKAICISLLLFTGSILVADLFLPFLGTLQPLLTLAYLLPAITLILMWRVNSQVAAGVFVTALWGIISLNVILISGTNSVVFVAYLLVVYLAALIMPRRRWYGILTASLLVGGITTWMTWQGIYTPPAANAPVLWFMPFGVLSLGGLLVYAGTRQVSLAFVIVEQNSKALETGRALLEERSAELATTNARLQREISEREQSVQLLQATEAALRHSERRYRLVFENDPSAVILSDLTTGEIIDANEGATKLFGYGRTALLEKNLSDLTLEDQATGNHLFAEPTISEHAIINNFGEHIPAEVRSVHLVDANGRDLLQSSIIDITERHYALQALQESEGRYRTLVENAPEALLVIDVQNHCFVEVNQKAASLFGLTRIELLARSVEDVLCLPDDLNTLERLAQAAESGEQLTRESVQTRGDGREFSAELYITKLPAGNRHFIRVSVFDISKRKEMEQRREQEKKQLEMLISSLPGSVAITTADETGTILWVNDEMCDKFHVKREEVIGKSIRQYYAKCEQTHESLVETLINHGHLRNFEFEAQDSLGRKFWARSSITAIEYDGRPCLLGIVDDIDDQKRQQLATRQAQKLEGLGVLAGGIAHDFNNLLVAILGQATLAVRKLEDSHPAKKHVEKSVTATRRASQLTKQILAYSGHGSFELRDTAMNNILRDSYQLFDATLPNHVKYDIELGEAVPLIKADPTQMQQLVMNLLMYAGEVSVEGGRVSVRTRTLVLSAETLSQYTYYTGAPLQPGCYMSLTVCDDSTGLDEAGQEKLFDPFVTPTVANSGLGLAAVLGIVRGHCGGVRVKSCVTHGTIFEIVFPAVKIKRSQGSVLVIDNEYAVREAVSDILSADGLQVFTADGSNDGLSCFAQRHDEIDLVMLDNRQIETLRGLHKIDPTVQVLLSADPDGSWYLLPELPIAGCIEKPFDALTLTTEVQRLLDN